MPQNLSTTTVLGSSARWMSVVVWATFIFWMSTERFGSTRSRPLLAKFLGSVHINLSAANIRILNVALRKLAHVIEYAIFAFLLYRAFEGQDRLVWRSDVARWCIVVGAFYSLTDQFHQMCVRERGGSLIDCAIDTTGLTVGILVVYLASRTLRLGG